MNYKHYRRTLEDSQESFHEEPKSSIQPAKPHPKDPILGYKSKPIPPSPNYEKRVKEYLESRKNKLAASKEMKKAPAIADQDRDLIHYSSQRDLKTLDPKFMGTGVSGHHTKRGIPENKSVFFYTAESEPESIVATPDKIKYKAKIKPEHKVYDLESDPANLMSEFRKQNQGIWNEDAFHGYLKDKGFHGVRWKMRDNTSVVQMYYPMEVEEMQKGARGDWQKEGYRLDHKEIPEVFRGKSTGFVTHHVTAVSPDGQKVGHYQFSQWPAEDEKSALIDVNSSNTHPEHQRKGLASAAYKFIEKKTGKKIKRQGMQTQDAKKLSEQPNGLFGKSTLKKEPHPFKVGDRVKNSTDEDTVLFGTVTAIKTEKGNKHKIKVRYDNFDGKNFKYVGHGGKWDLWDHAGYWEKDSDLEKGKLANLVAAGVLGLSPVSNSPNLTPDQQPTQKPATIITQEKTKEDPKEDPFEHKMLRTIASVESSNNVNTNHGKLPETGIHKGTSAFGKYGLTPVLIKETARLSPALAQKHPDLNKLSLHEIAGYMKKNPGLEDKIAKIHLNRLRSHFGDSPEKIGHAWLNGITGTKRAIRDGKPLEEHWHVKKILNSFGKSIKLSIFETFENLEKSEAPKYEGHIDPIKQRVGKMHPNGILMWHQVPEIADKHDRIINNPKHLETFLSKIPDTHKDLMRKIIKYVASDPNRHFIPTEENGKNKLRARHIKELILGSNDIKIDTSEPNTVKISRQSHSQGQNAGRSINFEFSQKRKV